MILDPATIRDRYGVALARLAHVGANDGQEVETYLAAGARELFLFEPLAGPFARLEARCDALGGAARFHLFRTALGEAPGEAAMHVAGGEAAASSLLRPAMTRRDRSRLGFSDRTETVPVRRLDAIPELAEGVDLLVIDVQGFELAVLRGAGALLERIPLVICELNREPSYEGSATVADIDAFMAARGFRRMLTHWPSRSWGDGLYVRAALVPEGAEPVETDAKRPRGLARRLAARVRRWIGGRP